MKNIFAFMIISLSLFFCSCTSRANDTYFVHSIGFETENDNIKLTAVLEKLSKDEEKYFTAVSSASSIDSAAEKLTKEYNDCYFATCDLYFIASSVQNDTLSKIAKSICDSNIFPSTSNILCIKDTEPNDFLSRIKNSEHIGQIKKEASKKKVNTASFFAHYYSENSISLDTFSFTDGSFRKIGKTTFNKNGKATFNE